ncbi:MAG: amidohydrolase family protein, partial [Firmicutes bacterium]|nr:amidohydrolase family protein [Bacillota bacterium]
MAAERIFINGNIYTVNNEKPYAEAMAVSGQDLIYVGDTAGAMALVGPGTEVVDLEGKTVLPGLIENHIHPIQVGVLMEEVDADKKSKEDILAFVKAKAEEIPEGGFIGGFGWNQELWEDNQFPSKEDLDSVAPNHYVVLARTCGHAYWLNSKAMEKAGITEDIQNPVGGEFVRKPDGTLLGVLTDTACEWVQGIMPEYT